jgi:hypothetical protein
VAPSKGTLKLIHCPLPLPALVLLPSTDGSGVRLRLAYELTNQLQAGVHYSHDNNFQSRGTGDLKFRFGTGSSGKNSQQLTMPPVVQALTATPTNRDVRVANSTANPREGASAL